jgi:hypothetical protein
MLPDNLGAAEVPQEIDDGIHAALIARKASNGNLP